VRIIKSISAILDLLILSLKGLLNHWAHLFGIQCIERESTPRVGVTTKGVIEPETLYETLDHICVIDAKVSER
jgi:hypothetical protein